MARRKAMLDGIVRQISTKLFLQDLACFLLLDIAVFLLLGYSSWAWRALCTVEFLILAFFLNQNSKLIRSMLAPLEAMGETADVLGQSELRPEDLEYLIARLDNINVSHLGSRVNVPQSRELAGLTRAINAMLERIDQGYQAQARFVSDASHELRTPIAVIQGYANLLSRWGKDNPAAREEAIDAIVQESASMARMVDQLLFLTRGDNDTQTVRLEQTDLTLLADEVARETSLLETGRNISAQLDPLVLVRADAGLMKQALRVLVDNAVKYTSDGDEIRITLRAGEGYARLSVSDSGRGIPPKELAAIFRRFYRTEESRSRETGGSGLGLSIAHWIAQRHGGWIEVVSRPGAGSRFTLVLPLERLEEGTENR